ncbi:hypothetical protein Ancab_003030 [Ancistrocladus abbreviatus]
MFGTWEVCSAQDWKTSAIASARANVCASKGTWMYEVILETAGVQQLGWATVSCPFTDCMCVGDAEDSHAFDDENKISFYRNGISLRVAFSGTRKMVPGPPSANALAFQLLQCLYKLVELQRVERAEFTSMEKLGRLKTFVPLEDNFHPVVHAICEEFFSILDEDVGDVEYIAWGPLLSLLMEVYGMQSLHDYRSLDKVLDILLEFRISCLLFRYVIGALSRGCKTAPVVLTECSYTGSYCHLELACHLLELMMLWWNSSEFPNSYEDLSHANSMTLTTTALSSAIAKVAWPPAAPPLFVAAGSTTTFRGSLQHHHSTRQPAGPQSPSSSPSSPSTQFISMMCSGGKEIEEKHRDLCCLAKQVIPHVTPPHLPSSVFGTFLQNLLLKNRGADCNIPSPGVLSNSVLVSVSAVILNFLSEGFPRSDICGWSKGSRSYGKNVDSVPKVLEDAAHTIPRSAHVAAECSDGSLSDEIADKPSSSKHSDSLFEYQPVQQMRIVPRETQFASATLREEELLNSLLLLYHIGVAPNFKQASCYMSGQAQSLSLLEETDKQMREGAGIEQQKQLKEAQNIYQEEVIDCARHSTWHR